MSGEVIEDTNRVNGKREGLGRCRYAGKLEECIFKNGIRVDQLHIDRMEATIAAEQFVEAERQRKLDQAEWEKARQKAKARRDAWHAAQAAKNKAIRDSSEREDARRSRKYWNEVFDATTRNLQLEKTKKEFEAYTPSTERKINYPCRDNPKKCEPRPQKHCYADQINWETGEYTPSNCPKDGSGTSEGNTATQ